MTRSSNLSRQGACVCIVLGWRPRSNRQVCCSRSVSRCGVEKMRRIIALQLQRWVYASSGEERSEIMVFRRVEVYIPDERSLSANCHSIHPLFPQSVSLSSQFSGSVGSRHDRHLQLPNRKIVQIQTPLPMANRRPNHPARR